MKQTFIFLAVILFFQLGGMAQSDVSAAKSIQVKYRNLTPWGAGFGFSNKTTAYSVSGYLWENTNSYTDAYNTVEVTPADEIELYIVPMKSSVSSAGVCYITLRYGDVLVEEPFYYPTSVIGGPLSPRFLFTYTVPKYTSEVIYIDLCNSCYH